MKRLFAMLVTLALVLGLSACGGPPEVAPTETQPTTVPETTAVPTEDPRVVAYGAAMALLEKGDFDAAREAFASLGDYSDAQSQVKECDYRKAAALLEAGENRAAWELYGRIPGYKDADTLRESCRFLTVLTKTVSEVQDELRYETVYTYKNGRLAEEVTTYNREHPDYTESDPVFRTVYEYDGKVTTLRTFDGNGGLIAIEIGTFDDAGKMVRRNMIYVQNSASSFTCTYTYNEKGQVVEQLYWSGDGIGEGNADIKYTMQYDSDGNETVRSTYTWSKKYSYSSTYAWKLFSTVTFDYGIDDYGIIHWYADSSSDTTTEFQYNAQGLVESQVISRSGYQSTVAYTYDESGNLLRESTVTDNSETETRSVLSHTYEPVELFPDENTAAEETAEEE